MCLEDSITIQRCYLLTLIQAFIKKTTVMTQNFFYKNNQGETLGPLDVNQLKLESSSGNLLPENLVWQDGGTSSYVASNIKGLFVSNDPPPLDHSAGINLNPNNNAGSSPSSEPQKAMETAKQLASSIGKSLKSISQDGSSNSSRAETNQLSWATMPLGQRITIISTAVAVLSMFFNWVDVGMVSQTGFGQTAYLLLLFWIYPVFGILKNKKLNFLGECACSLGSTICALVYIYGKQEELMGRTISGASTGAYLFLFASLSFTFAVFKYRR